MQIALVERDGTAWGATIELQNTWRDYEIPLAHLQPVPLALLPRPYPQFLPYLMRVETSRVGPRPAEIDTDFSSPRAPTCSGTATRKARTVSRSSGWCSSGWYSSGTDVR